MDLLLYFLIFGVSLSALIMASDWFVNAAEKIGLSFGVSPFIIGVTIVAFGTSLPELATSIASIFAGSSEIVIGNVIGSNVTNILLVLGLTAIVAGQIKMDFDVMDIDIPLLLASAIFLYFVLSDNEVSYFEASLFLAALMVFLVNSFNQTKNKDERPKANLKHYGLLFLGGAVVYLGATYTIYGIENIASILRIDEDFIAISVLALGTSLPEIVVSIVAAKKGKPGIAVGNVLGSNIFNTYAVVGISRFFGDLVIPESIQLFSLPFMVFVSIIFAVICVTNRISRWEGTMLILFYVFFIGELSQGLF